MFSKRNVRTPASQDRQAGTPLGPAAHDGGRSTPLAALTPGTGGRVQALTGEPSLVSRLVAMGFTPGAGVRVLQNAGHGPMIVMVRDARVALGDAEATQVLMARTEQGDDYEQS